jgi:hypothetical protein
MDVLAQAFHSGKVVRWCIQFQRLLLKAPKSAWRASYTLLQIRLRTTCSCAIRTNGVLEALSRVEYRTDGYFPRRMAS